MSRQDALAYNYKQLQIASNPVLRHVHTACEYIISDLKTGHRRDYSMTRDDLVPHLTALRDKMVKRVFEEKSPLNMVRPLSSYESMGIFASSNSTLTIRSSLSKPSCNSRFLRRPVNLAVGVMPGEPSYGAWILQGDVVEAREQRPPRKQYRWYYGTEELISSSGWFNVRFANGRSSYIPRKSVRAYVPLRVGEKVEYSTNGKFCQCKIVRVHEDGEHVDIVISKDGLKVRNVLRSSIRRPNRDEIVKERKNQ
jgi:hypothetical protein